MARILRIVVIALSFLVPSYYNGEGFAQTADGSADSGSADSGSALEGSGSTGETEAKPKKKRKKRPSKRKAKPAVDSDKPASESEGSPAGGAKAAEVPKAGTPATGIHAKQSGIDNPYSWHMALLSNFGKTESKQGGVKGGNATYNFQLKALYIMGAQFEVGPEIEFFESSAKQGKDTNKSSAWVGSLVFAMNFGNIDSDIVIPFVDLKVGAGQETDKFGESTTISSISKFGLGLGLHWFVDSNVAFTGRMGYGAGTAKSKTKTGSETVDGGDPVTSTSIDYLDIGFSLFL